MAGRAATPADFRQKVGVYVWGALASGLPAAAEDAKRLGADQAVRVFIGPGTSWDPANKNDNSPLDVKARREDYRAFLAAFPVVMLTAYDAASSERYKWVPLDAEHLAATTDEFRRFAIELAKTPGRKIISNWEFENDCPRRSLGRLHRLLPGAPGRHREGPGGGESARLSGRDQDGV